MPLLVLPQARPEATYRYLCPGRGGQVQQRSLEVVGFTVRGLPEALEGLVLTADLQGRELSLPHRLLGEQLAIDLPLPQPKAWGVLLAGDFYADEAANRMGATGDVGPVWQAFGERFRWATGVLGNHDLMRSVSAHLLDGQLVELDGLRVAGVSGIIGKTGRRGRRSPDAYMELLERLIAQRPDVLVIHESPAQPPDLRGREELSEFLSGAEGLLVVCGHCHWPRPLAHLGPGVQVLNVDARVVLLRRE